MLKNIFCTNILYIKNRNYYEVVTIMECDDVNRKMQEPKSLADLIGNHIGRYELSEHKKKSHALGQKVALACGTGMALMLGGLFANEHYNQNQAHYDSRITQAIQEHIMERMPTNPIVTYQQNNNYE